MNSSKSPTLTSSILDRLIETDSIAKTGFGYTLPKMREAIRRDLEVLFNTLPVLDESSTVSPELRRSVLAYGFPDLTSLQGDPSRIQRLLVQQIQSTLSYFEPRLRDVRISPTGLNQFEDGTITVMIEARLTDSPEHRFEFSISFHSKGGHHSVS
jgi:type VI secretion system protein ImpF